MRQRLQQHLLESEKIKKFEEALNHVNTTNATGSPEDANTEFTPLIDPRMEFCTSVFKSFRNASHVIDTLNQLLPIKTDKEMIQGGLLSEGVIHEMLIQKYKILAVRRYCEMAARLLTPGSFPIWQLFGVSIAFGGKCVDDVQSG